MSRRKPPTEDPDDLDEFEERRRNDTGFNYSIDRDEETSLARQPLIGSLVHRFGTTALLGAVAAIVTSIVAVVNTINSRNSPPPEVPPPASASSFNISDYWSGIPDDSSQPLIFHLIVAGLDMTPGAAPRSGTVMGTMRNPCMNDTVARIDSGTWEDGHLRLTAKRDGKPMTLDVHRNGDSLDGVIFQSVARSGITLHRGEVGCTNQ